MKRPELNAALSPQEFEAWYWLKEELVGFSRSQGLSTVGLKREIQARIVDHLAGREPGKAFRSARSAAKMPQHFTLETVIGKGWRCGPALGAFMKSVLGNGFHFNVEMRDFIHHNVGQTLREAALCYQHSMRPGRSKASIPEQLEYNCHFREYFQQHPGATRQEAVVAWWQKRRARRTVEE